MKPKTQPTAYELYFNGRNLAESKTKRFLNNISDNVLPIIAFQLIGAIYTLTLLSL